MNKLKTIMAACAACALTSTAMAADPDGTINFTGEIISASCTVTGESGTVVSGQSINVPLGKVSMSSITSAGAGNIVAGASIHLSLDCSSTSTGLTAVKFNFDPVGGSGIDTSDNRLLKTTGAATGVGIGLFNEANQLINLAGGQAYSATLTAAGANKYAATMRMRASYVANGATLAVGAANGTLPFSMTYE